MGRSPSEIANSLEKFKKQNFPESQSDTIRRIRNIPEASQLENPKLRECVGRKIGFIYTRDDENLTAEDKALGVKGISEKDKMIIADLFSTGKINVLFATPAIGIGVNVKIRNMYLPTLNKPEGTGKDFTVRNELVNKRELSQLINRAGRSKNISISSIHTPNEFADYVREVISMQSKDFNEVPAIQTDHLSTSDFIKFLIKIKNAPENVRQAAAGKVIDWEQWFLNNNGTSSRKTRIISKFGSIFNFLRTREENNQRNDNIRQKLEDQIQHEHEISQRLYDEINRNIQSSIADLTVDQIIKNFNKIDFGHVIEIEANLHHVEEQINKLVHINQELRARQPLNVNMINQNTQHILQLNTSIANLLVERTAYRTAYVTLTDAINNNGNNPVLIQRLTKIKNDIDNRYGDPTHGNLNGFITETYKQMVDINTRLNTQIDNCKQSVTRLEQDLKTNLAQDVRLRKDENRRKLMNLINRLQIQQSALQRRMDSYKKKYRV